MHWQSVKIKNEMHVFVGNVAVENKDLTGHAKVDHELSIGSLTVAEIENQVFTVTVNSIKSPTHQGPPGGGSALTQYPG